MTENTMSTEDEFTANVSLRRNDAHHRYELLVDGKLAVQAFFRDLPGHIDFTHTETGKDFEGRGLAGVLAHFALDDVVATVNASSRTARSCPATCASTRATNSSSTGRSASPPGR